MFHKIKTVSPLPNLVLLVRFAEGQTKQYDLKPLIPQIPAFRSFQTTTGLFEQVQVDAGGYGISWNDDLDLACDELWANGIDVETPFDRLIAFGDATDLWGLNESTLRKAVSYRKLVEGVDVQKFGKQWVVTLDAMEREYGKPRQNLAQ